MRGNLDKYIPQVYRLAMRLTGDVHLAEDLTQETFLRAWERLPQLTHELATRSWLFRIAINLYHDGFRNRKTAVATWQPRLDQIQEVALTPDLVAEAKDELARALRLMDSLPERQRLVLYLIAVENLEIAEVCKILEINLSAAKANLSLARKRMREERARL